MALQKPKGTQDILPGKVEAWQYVEQVARDLFADYAVKEVRTPIFEHYEVICRVGDSTDIVQKEMYDFYDKGDRHITLRPEGTAPVVRAYVEHKLFGNDYVKPYKTYYIGPMFRYERPQAGRLRQFHQIGVEMFGSENPATDVEGISLALEYFSRLGIKDLKLVINTLGDKESRLRYREALIAYLEPLQDQMSEDSKRRLYQNPLRVLDSKEPEDKEIVANAPSILDYLNEESAAHFAEVKAMLEALNIDYIIDTNMVRGLDYYNHTIFEIMSDSKAFDGKLTTVCAGGRYNGLVEELGGPEVPSFGFALGIERLLLTLEAEHIELPIDNSLDVYIVGIGQEVNVETLKLAIALRHQGYKVERDYLNRKPKAQFKTANKMNARFVLTLGLDELEKQEINLKNMNTGEQKTVPLASIYEDFNALYMEMMEEA